MMKKNWKGILTGGTILALLAGTLAVPTLAKVGSQTARLDYHNMKITLDGKEIQLTDSRGNSVEPFTIDGTTYLPVASLSRMLGLDVEWDGPNNTVILTTDQYVDVPADGDYIGLAKAKTIALDHAGLKESQVTFVRTVLRTSGGRAAYKIVFYQDSDKYFYDIDALTGDILIYDREDTGYIPGSTQSDDDIGSDKAKAIALDHAGLKESQTSFLRVNLDRDDGRRVYDVEFYSGSREYDYEIDAATGDIVSFDFDVEGYIAGSSQSDADIGADKAKSIALDHAGLKSSSVTFLKAKLDYDDGRRVYDVEFYSSSKEYDYEIDAATGDILSYDFDAESYTPSSGNGSGSYISESRAKQIVEDRAGVSGTFREFKLDYDDGRAVYEGEMRADRMEYEFEIDAVSGAILEWDADWD